MKLYSLLRTIFSVTRTPNLIIICLTLLLVRYTIVQPILGLSSITSSISGNMYLLMIISTLFIAAGGYIINDYHDTGIDQINKPGKNQIGITLSKKSSLIIYFILTVSGLAGSFIFGHLTGMRYAVFIFLLSTGLLYFYSTSYKKMFLVGNLTISFLAGLSIFLSILFDKHALASESVLTLVAAYAIFGFIVTMIREIIKDCEDAEGDYAFNSNTLPLAIGVNFARVISSLLTILTFGSILYIQIIQSQWESPLSFGYVLVFIQIPILILSIRCFLAKNSKQDHQNSTLAKIIMVTGILSMLVFYLSFR